MDEYPGTKPISRTAGLLILAVGFGLAYLMYPAGILDLPFAQLTLRKFGDFVLSVGIAGGTVYMVEKLWKK
jgi:uncharacterized protein YjeT (DUF2065 family)